MYQITDGTFAEARHLCIHDHVVVEEVRGTIGNRAGLPASTRAWCQAIGELTSAYLDRSVAIILERRHSALATPQRQQMLAALIHLCGAGAGDEFARRGFRLMDGQQCGDHQARAYLDRVNAMKAVFDRLGRD